jgi:lysyl-tRNA synthetase class 2
LIDRQQHIAPILTLRSKILQAVRDFFTGLGFLEVETPLRIPAPAPEPFINAHHSGTWYLQTSPELCMKRLLAAGYPKIFQICKCFRREERGQRHLEEFTMLEWYGAGATYRDLMDQTEGLFQFLLAALPADFSISRQGRAIDFKLPWDRISVTEAFEKFSPMSIAEALAADRFDEIIAFDIEPRLGLDKPVFLYDYPAGSCTLAAPCPDRPGLAQRFELYAAGLELCNGFTELTDPDEQRRRFSQEIARRLGLGQEAPPMPEKFLDDLGRMPPAAGNALGLDRLIMLITGSKSIDGVVAFTPEEL